MSGRMETPLKRVRGLGTARSGAHHWWLERLTSVSTLILFGWFILSLVRLPALDRTTVTEWLASPLAGVPMALLVVSTFWHLKLGLAVFVEDYVHDGARLFWLTLINFLSLLGAGIALFAILKIAIAGSAA